ncbi:MAG: hypothetical protein HZB51_08245 [Chloroflexi bacterium]|nr:hypothetical protein [Chloroflexota bacterium]
MLRKWSLVLLVVGGLAVLALSAIHASLGSTTVLTCNPNLQCCVQSATVQSPNGQNYSGTGNVVQNIASAESALASDSRHTMEWQKMLGYSIATG